MATAPRATDSSWIVVAVRALLVALAAGAVVAATIASGRGPSAAARHYACPMHSEVTAAQPGDCPICGMALAELDATAGPAMTHAATAGGAEAIALGALRASAEATSLLRFSVAPVRRNALPGEIFAPAVVEADGTIAARLYRDELASLDADETAELVPSTSPAAPIAIQRSGPPPIVADDDRALARVEFRASPGQAAPPPGQIGWVKLAYKIRAMLVVRSTAILSAPDGPYVLVFSAVRGALTRRPIEIGKEYAGMTAVVSGLRDKELVVMANAFALDAERRLQVAP
jgi:hypothetical protein